MVSNRRIFVYKDESEHVFYMKLSWYKVEDAAETEQNLHMIDLLVFGCDEPGDSITDALVCLLKRKLLTLTLDALSGLLTKNPWLNLLESDIEFIRGFSSALGELDQEKRSESTSTVRTYLLPAHVRDPLILLLMFR